MAYTAWLNGLLGSGGQGTADALLPMDRQYTAEIYRRALQREMDNSFLMQVLGRSQQMQGMQQNAIGGFLNQAGFNDPQRFLGPPIPAPQPDVAKEPAPPRLFPELEFVGREISAVAAPARVLDID